MNPLILALLGHLGNGMYGASPNAGLGSSPLLTLILHGLAQHLSSTGAASQAPPGNGSSGTPGRTAPIMRRQPTSGTPSLQGFLGNTSSMRNPNQGGYGGLGMSEMTHPGLASGMYGPSGFGLLQQAR